MIRRDGWIEVALVEGAPWNIGTGRQQFVGVGSHLFAYACKRSFELGFEGYVAFFSKTNLIQHHTEKLGAKLVDPRRRRMIIETSEARDLVEKYFGEGDRYG